MSPDHAPRNLQALETHADALRRVARGLVRDPGDADDLLQEAALLALTGRATPRRRPFAFWAGVLRNLARHGRRGDARRGQRERRAGRPETVGATDEAVERLDASRRVLEAVRRLREPNRTALILRYFEDLPPRKIARRLGVPVDTVKARLRRGLDVLRSDLDARHDGRREAWLGAVLPWAGARALTVGGTATGLSGGAMTIGVGSRWAAAGAALLLLGGGTWFATAGLRRGPERPARTLPRPAVERDASLPVAPERGPPAASLRGRPSPASASPTEASARAEAPQKDDVASVSAATPAFSPTRLDEARFRHAPPAQVASPYGPPPGSASTRLGARGGSGPTGHWTRFFGLPPAKGTARLAVQVLDQAKRPVPKATVYLGPPTAAGSDAVSFGDLRTLGVTGADGVLRSEALPAGAGIVAANVQNRLNGRRGLDVRSSEQVLLEEQKEARVIVTLPFALAETGSVHGRILEEGSDRPVRGAAVASGFLRVWSAADGGFRLEGLPAGPTTIQAGATGRASETVKVDVPAGGDQEVVVRLPFAEQGGLEVHGMARLPDGSPVAGALVYLMVVKDRGTLRRTTTDEQGAFVLSGLPERVEEEACRIQVTGYPRYRTGMLELPDGIHDTEVSVEVPGAYAHLQLHLLDAATGEAIRVANVAFVRDGAASGRRGALVLDRGTGTWQAYLEGGRGTVEVSTLSHGTWSRLVDLPSGGGDVSITARLTRLREDPVQVALGVTVTRTTDEAPVTKARVEVLDEEGAPLVRFEGPRPDGRYRLPTPSGTWKLRVQADGYETLVQDLVIGAGEREHEVSVRLVPMP